jgi:hypothetical protein
MGLLDKVKETANKAAEGAKHATAVGKEKFEDARLSKKIGDLLQEIGDIVVKQRRNDAPADADAQIDAKVAEITDLEAQMAANAVDAPESETPTTESGGTETDGTKTDGTEAAS